jgi:SAM-dependent methyltransferase
VDLGMNPYADTFIPESKLSDSEPVFPLACSLCTECGQIQTVSVTDPMERYVLHEYSYTSSNSSFSRSHWVKYANDVPSKVNLKNGALIVEVGSNDGFLSEQFLKQGHRVLGVDPSKYMADLAQKRGVSTIIALFDTKVAKEIRGQNGQADLIVANNVFNHSNSPLDFARGCSELLSPNGTFVFELPYWFSGLTSGHFDHIYHEHVTYFTVKSSLELLERCGMGITRVEFVDYHGGSIRVFAKSKEAIKRKSVEVKLMIEKEIHEGTFLPKTYRGFMKNILYQRSTFLKQIHEIKLIGKPIVAVGAAAKGNTLLNFYNLDNSIIDYVTDVSPHKQGKYTPLTRIPICSDDIFSNYKDVYAFILSWNISDIIKKILHDINPDIKFLELGSW